MQINDIVFITTLSEQKSSHFVPGPTLELFLDKFSGDRTVKVVLQERLKRRVIYDTAEGKCPLFAKAIKSTHMAKK